MVERLNEENEYATEVGTASEPLVLTSPKMSLNDKAFWLLSFIACTVGVLNFLFSSVFFYIL